MPRRASATSFGGKAGNPINKTIPGPGAQPQTMRDRMKLLLERKKTMQSIEAVLDDPDHKHFATILNTTLDRAEGKVPTAVDLTSKGEKVSGVVVLPATEEPKA